VEISAFLGQGRDARIYLLPYFWEKRNFPSWKMRGRIWGVRRRGEEGKGKERKQKVGK
jgi:hypothetical protein